MDLRESRRDATPTPRLPWLWTVARDDGSPVDLLTCRRNGDVWLAQVFGRRLEAILPPGGAAENRSQQAGGIRSRSFDNDRVGARQQHARGALRGIGGGYGPCSAEESPRRLGRCRRESGHRITSRTRRIIE